MSDPTSPVASMTGFARADGTLDGWSWTWELRSVNAKGLDLRVRLPAALETLEAKVRDRIAKTLSRGSVTANLTLDRSTGSDSAEITVNEAFLEQLLGLQRRLEDKGLVLPTAPSLDRILAVRGVVEVAERRVDADTLAALGERVMVDLDAALPALLAARRGEGQRLAALLTVHLNELSTLTAEAEVAAQSQPESLRKRIDEQLALLLGASPPVSEERLAQELALLATKADVREETDRLKAHVEACRALLVGGGPIGRKLDFLCQELNREANTLCSKSVDLTLTNIGVGMKTRIERFREQIQNVE